MNRGKGETSADPMTTEMVNDLPSSSQSGSRPTEKVKRETNETLPPTFRQTDEYPVANTTYAIHDRVENFDGNPL